MSSSWTGAPREPQRLSRAEIESRLLDTARQLIQRAGLTVSLEHLRLDELLELADVPKTSFYRVWQSKDYLLRRRSRRLDAARGRRRSRLRPETIRVAGGMIASTPTCWSPPRAGSECCARRSAWARSRTSRRCWLDRGAAPASRRASRHRGRGGARAHQDGAAGGRERLPQPHGRLLRRSPRCRYYRLREHHDEEYVAAAGAAVVEGCAALRREDPELVDGTVTGPAIDGDRPTGASRRWASSA